MSEGSRPVRALISRPQRDDLTRPAVVDRPRRTRPYIAGEMVIVFLLLEVYGYLRSLADTRYADALRNGRAVLDLERHLRLDFELAWNRWLVDHQLWQRVASEVYQHTHTSFTMAILLWCYLAGPGIYRPARNALILINLVGLAVFFVLPVMPPRLLPGSGFVDTVASAGYGTEHTGPVAISPAQFAAMPSLHMAWALWVSVVAMILLRRYRRLRWLAWSHSISTAIAVVVTANHYVLDVVAGGVVAAAAFAAVGLVWAGEGTAYFGGQLIRRPVRTLPRAPVVPAPVGAAPVGAAMASGDGLAVRAEEAAG